MTPRLPVLSLVAMTGLVAALGWHAGQPVSEGDILRHYAEQWVAQGGRMNQCSGVPGEGPVRIVITCRKGAQSAVWRVDGRGREITGPQGPRV